MGRELFRTQPVFRAALEECQEILRPLLERPLLDYLYPHEGPKAAARKELDRPGIVQPALLAFQYALAQLWRSWGIEPDAVMGHSLGEYAAA